MMRSMLLSALRRRAASGSRACRGRACRRSRSGACPRMPAACARSRHRRRRARGHPCGAPARRRSASTASMRCTSDSLLISSEKNATGFLPSMAACCAMLSTNAVLPIDGRAATMTRSAGWKPDEHLVEVGEAGRHAGDRALALRAASRASPSPARAAPSRARSPALSRVWPSAKMRVLGQVEQVVRRLARFERLLHDLGGRLDEAPQRCAFSRTMRAWYSTLADRRHGVDEERRGTPCRRSARVPRAAPVRWRA